MLRVSGADFDVDQYLAQVEMSAVVLKARRKGTRDRPGQKMVYEFSDVNMLVSNHEFSEVDAQIEDALTFLQTYAAELCLLATYSGVEDIVFDFGIEDRDVVAQADYFPPELLQRMGELRIGLVVSRYPRDVEGNSSASDAAKS